MQVDFSPYGIDMHGFPFGVWKRITKNILNDSNSELFAQGEPQGDYDLRMTISRYLHSSRGVNCRPEQIIVGAGNDYLLLLLEKILGRHVGIAMENPTYKRAYRIFQSFAYRIYTVDMDDKGMRADRLSGLPVRAAYVMPSHQYPTGAVMTIPGVIFSESMLSYLHIINLETSSLTSIGTLLSGGQAYLSTYPHIIMFPAIFIAILEIAFNLFGNGLRDALNPSLRGADD